MREPERVSLPLGQTGGEVPLKRAISRRLLLLLLLVVGDVVPERAKSLETNGSNAVALGH